MTTPNIRSTLIKALVASWLVGDDPANQAIARDAAGRDVDTILAALVQLRDTGDPCERMLTKAREAGFVYDRSALIGFDWDDYLKAVIKAVASVRDEHATHLVARLAVAEHTAEREVAEHQVTRERLNESRAEAARVGHRHRPIVKTDADGNEINVCLECDGIREQACDEAAPVLWPCPTAEDLGATAPVPA